MDKSNKVSSLDCRSAAITTEPSPTKFVNYKIEPVNSPEVEKRRFPVRCTPISDKPSTRKKRKKSHVVPRKLDIIIKKVPKRLCPVTAQKNLTKLLEEPQKNDGTSRPVKQLHCSSSSARETGTNSFKTQFEPGAVAIPTNESHRNDREDRTKEPFLVINSDVEPLNSCIKIRSATIENVDSPRKNPEKKLCISTDDFPEKLDDKIDEISVHLPTDHLLSCDYALKKDDNVSEKSENDIFCSPEIIRPRKKKKYRSDSLADRCNLVCARTENEKILFSYELKAGLRVKSGQFVSADLVVISILRQSRYLILLCKSLSQLSNDLGRSRNRKILNLKILVFSSVNLEIAVNSIINLHFPLTIILDPNLKACIILVENRIVVKSSHLASESCINENLEGFNIVVDDFFKTKRFVTNGLEKCMRVIQCNEIRSGFLDCFLAQPLIFKVNLEVTILHLYQLFGCWKALMCDKENRYGSIEIDADYIVKCKLNEDKFLKMEGCKAEVTGFTMVDCTPFNRELLNLTCYIYKNEVKQEVMYEAQSVLENFNIVCLRESVWPKSYSSLSFILTENRDFKRYGVRVTLLKTTFKGIIIGDISYSDGLLLDCVGSPYFKIHQVPMIVDAIFFLQGQLYADIYSKAINV